MKKIKKRKNHKYERYLNGVRIIFILLFVLLGGSYVRKIHNDVLRSPLVESPKTEMKAVPVEMRRKVNVQVVPSQIRIPILMYHYVENVQDQRDTIRQSLNVSPSIFEEQLKTLQNAGYIFITATELGDILYQSNQIPSNIILLTFDDGHWDFATTVLPLLKKYNIKATAYIISNFIGNSDFMSKTQLQEVINSTLVDVGAHTMNHVSLRGLPMEDVEKEVLGSKTWLETAFKLKVTAFAYPNGAFDEQAAKVVERAGYTTGVSTIAGNEQSQSNRYYLYRLRPGQRVGKALLDWLAQIPPGSK